MDNIKIYQSTVSHSESLQQRHEWKQMHSQQHSMQGDSKCIQQFHW